MQTSPLSSNSINNEQNNNKHTKENSHSNSTSRLKKEDIDAASKKTGGSHAKRNLLIIAGVMLAIGAAFLIGAAGAFAVLLPALVISATTISFTTAAIAGILSIITGLVLGIIGLTRKGNTSVKSGNVMEDKHPADSTRTPEVKPANIKKKDAAHQSPETKINPLEQPNADLSKEEREEIKRKVFRNLRTLGKKMDENHDWRVDVVTSELESKFEGEELSEGDKEILKIISDFNKNTVPQYKAHHNLHNMVNPKSHA